MGDPQGMVFPPSRAGEGNELPAELPPVPAQPENTWKRWGSKGEKDNLQFMGLRNIPPPPTHGGSENAVNQPEASQIWHNCVAVTQGSRGFPLRGGVGRVWLGREEEIGGGCLGAPTDLSNFTLQTRFLPRRPKPLAGLTGRSDPALLPLRGMLPQPSPPPLPSQVTWGPEQSPRRGGETRPHTRVWCVWRDRASPCCCPHDITHKYLYETIGVLETPQHERRVEHPPRVSMGMACASVTVACWCPRVGLRRCRQHRPRSCQPRGTRVSPHGCGTGAALHRPCAHPVASLTQPVCEERCPNQTPRGFHLSWIKTPGSLADASKGKICRVEPASPL